MRLSPCRPACPTCPQDAGPRAGGRPVSSARRASEVSATLTCACMSTVVRTGRDAKVADWVPVSRDPRPLMGSRHATREPDRPGAKPPATPATFEFQPPRCKLAAQSAEANRRGRRSRELITVPSASGATPPESGLLSSDPARKLDSLDTTSGSALPLFSLFSLLCAELPALPLGFLRPLVASEVRMREGGNTHEQRRLSRVGAERAPPSGCC